MRVTKRPKMLFINEFFSPHSLSKFENAFASLPGNRTQTLIKKREKQEQESAASVRNGLEAKHRKRSCEGGGGESATSDHNNGRTKEPTRELRRGNFQTLRCESGDSWSNVYSDGDIISREKWAVMQKESQFKSCGLGLPGSRWWARSRHRQRRTCSATGRNSLKSPYVISFFFHI